MLPIQQKSNINENIEELSNLIFNNIPVFEPPDRKIAINKKWLKYIDFSKNDPSQPIARQSLSFTASDILKECINKYNSHGQTPIYIACMNCNMKLFHLLRQQGADPTLKTNENNSNSNSNILHAIAWGNDSLGRAQSSFEDKQSAIIECLRYIPHSYLFETNKLGETYYHNLIMKHQNTIPKSILKELCSHQ